MITHVLFDFFGTLVDYSPTPIEEGYEKSYTLMRDAGYRGSYAEFVTQWQSTYAALDTEAKITHQEFSMSTLVQQIVGATLNVRDHRFERQLVATYLQEWNASVRYLPGVSDMLRRLRADYTLAIITNTHDMELVPMHLQAMGVDDLVDLVVTSVELGTRKPSVEIFDHTLKRLQVSAKDCLYVGDNHDADYLGGRAAGISSLLIDPRRAAAIPDGHRIESVLNIELRLNTCSKTT